MRTQRERARSVMGASPVVERARPGSIPVGENLGVAPGFIPTQVLRWPSSDRASAHEQASSEDRL